MIDPTTPEEREIIDRLTVELSQEREGPPDMLVLLTRAIRAGIKAGQGMRVHVTPTSPGVKKRVRALILARQSDQQIADAEKIDVETVRSLRRGD